LFGELGDARGAILSLAYLTEAAVTRGHPAIPPLKELLDQAEDLLQSLPAVQYLRERAVLWFQMGFASYMRGGDVHRGIRACQQAYLLARDLGDIPLQISAMASAIGSLACIGEFARGAELIQQAEKLLARSPNVELQTMFLAHLSHYYWYKGDLEKMAEVLGRAREGVEKQGLIYLYPVIRFYDLSLKLCLGEFQEAEEICGVLKGLTSVIGNRWFHGITLMLGGGTSYYRGNFLAAKEALAGAREILSAPESRAEIHLTFIKIWMGLVAYHLKENGEVEKGLREAIEHAREVGSFIFLKDAFMALALLKWQQGYTQEATRHLLAGLKLAQEHGHDITIQLSREDLLKICMLALDLGLKEVWDYVARLLSTRLAEVAGPELEKLFHHPDKRVAQKAWEIRRTMHRSRVPRLRIQTLGAFRVWRGESLLAEEDWEGRQPQLLLKAILAHGAQGAVKDVLLEDLWPDAEPEGAEKNFKVNLHRLRKALEPDLDKTFGSSYVHLKANLVSLDAQLCDLDVEKFLGLSKEGEKTVAKGQLKPAIALYKAAVASYGGDFLPEELYVPWLEARRADLRRTYLDLLHRLAGLYENQGSLTQAIDCYQQAVYADPLDEPACQRLMLLQAQRGRRSVALKTYQGCREALRRELNTEPDAATTAIYQKILSQP
jgi:LuxR family maltose regulon positive regulatory protein